MDKLTTLLGKPILTKSGKKLGTVDVIQLDRKLTTVKNIGYKNGEDLQFFPCSAIFAHDKDAIVLKSSTSTPYKNCITIPLGIAVYTVLGEYVSNIVDFKLEEFNVIYALLENKEQLSLNLCIGITDSIIIDREGKEKKQLGTEQQKKKVKRSNATTSPSTERVSSITETTNQTINLSPPIHTIQVSTPQLENNNTAQIVIPAHMEYTSNANNMSVDKNSLEFIPSNLHTLATNTSPAQTKSIQEIYASQQFLRQNNKAVGPTVLTGKRLFADLFDDVGNILIEKYTIIAPEHIKKAIDNNKLFQLIQLLNRF